MTNLRIGHGYDVHRLAAGRKLILGGVDIPYEKGLDGHSDADVLVHAVMDALLGAAGLEDIGCLFPDSSEEFRGISSLVLLQRVAGELKKRSVTVVNIDATIQYVLPEGEIVSEEDYHTVQSPYNTYENKGLPPGPIANPGMESIMAALNPNSTNYYYYALGDDGVHHFFSTNSAFQAFLNS